MVLARPRNCHREGMIKGAIIAEVAALVGDPARATMLSALVDGRAMSANELALAARITPQTASTHLGRLTKAGLLAVDRNGRHRYFQLATPKVAEMIEGIVAVALENRPRFSPVSPHSTSRRFAPTLRAPHRSAWYTGSDRDGRAWAIRRLR
jgi:DNA-binding transcriptional ArsR family regulator